MASEGTTGAELGIRAVLALAILGLVVALYFVTVVPAQEAAARQRETDLTRERMSDVRSALIAYRDSLDGYPSTLDSLVLFAQTDSAFAARIASEEERLRDVVVDLAREGIRLDAAGLSALGPDATELTEADFDDVDDFHGAPARPVEVVWMGEPLAFTDSVSVRYVDPVTLAPSVTPTLAKEVTVWLRALPAGWIGTPPVVAELRQIVSSAS